MRHTILFILAAAVLILPSGSARAQKAKAKSIPTSALEVSQPEFEFGRVAQGTSMSHTFWMKNAGDSNVFISDVKPGCGCTKAPFKAQNLAPGESTHVELIFSSGHYGSHVTKNAHILSNESGSVPSLIFHADVRPVPIMDSLDVFNVKPCLVDLDGYKDREDRKLEYDLTLKNRSDQDLSFRVVDRPTGLVDLDFPEGQAVHPGETMKFAARFDKAIASEVFTKSITIEASDKDRTRLTVPISKTMRWGPASTSQR